MCLCKENNIKICCTCYYVNYINLIGTPIELQKAIDYLKNEFEMKDLGRTKLCLDLQIEHLTNGIFVHQFAYTEKVLKDFVWIKRIH